MKKETKRVILFSVVIVCLCLIVSLFVVPALQSSTEGKVQNQTGTLPAYVLKSENDRIVVYDNVKGSSRVIADMPVSVLPPRDRQDLEKGIEVKDERELKRLLEDFCS